MGLSPTLRPNRFRPVPTQKHGAECCLSQQCIVRFPEMAGHIHPTVGLEDDTLLL